MQVMRTETGSPGTAASSWGSMPAADPGAAADAIVAEMEAALRG